MIATNARIFFEPKKAIKTCTVHLDFIRAFVHSWQQEYVKVDQYGLSFFLFLPL